MGVRDNRLYEIVKAPLAKTGAASFDLAIEGRGLLRNIIQPSGDSAFNTGTAKFYATQMG